MRAIQIKCPECGATLTTTAGASEARCDFCGKTSMIQRRTGILELRERLPTPPPSGPPGERPHVAVQPHSGTWIGIVLAFFFVVLPFVIGAAVCAGKTVARGPASLREPQWDGAPHGALLVDLDGDGIKDVIGRLHRIQPDEQLLGAFDGATGRRLWRGPSLGARNDVHLAVLALAGDTLLMSDAGATVSAFAAKDGSARWQVRLPEKVKRFCAHEGDPGAVLVHLADDTVVPVALASGATLAAPAAGGKACAALESDDADASRPEVTVFEAHSYDPEMRVIYTELAGLYARTALHHRPSDTSVQLAVKQPGTSIPTLVAMRGLGEPPGESWGGRDRSRPLPAPLWTAVVPAGDPLKAGTSALDPEEVDVGGGAVVAIYETQHTHDFRLTAFGLEDGRRLWDVAVPGTSPLGGVRAGEKLAYVSRWDALRVYDLATGALVYTVK